MMILANWSWNSCFRFFLSLIFFRVAWAPPGRRQGAAWCLSLKDFLFDANSDVSGFVVGSEQGVALERDVVIRAMI